MSENINGYILNEVGEAADWSTVEHNLLTSIVGKLPNAGSTVTDTSRHSHSILVTPDGTSVDPAVSVDNSGVTTISDSTGALLVIGETKTQIRTSLIFGSSVTVNDGGISDGEAVALDVENKNNIYVDPSDADHDYFYLTGSVIEGTIILLTNKSATYSAYIRGGWILSLDTTKLFSYSNGAWRML